MMTFPKWMCLQTMQFCKQTYGRCPDLGWKSWEIWVCLELRTSLTCQLASCWRPFFQSSSLGEASSIADVNGTNWVCCYSLLLQAFTKVAASTVRGQTVVEKMLCQRIGREKPHGNKFRTHGATLTAANWPGGRPTQPLSIQRSNHGQAQWTMGHSYAFGVKVRRGKLRHVSCPRNMHFYVCSIFPSEHTPTHTHVHTHTYQNLHYSASLHQWTGVSWKKLATLHRSHTFHLNTSPPILYESLSNQQIWRIASSFGYN